MVLGRETDCKVGVHWRLAPQQIREPPVHNRGWCKVIRVLYLKNVEAGKVVAGNPAREIR